MILWNDSLLFSDDYRGNALRHLLFLFTALKPASEAFPLKEQQAAPPTNAGHCIGAQAAQSSPQGSTGFGLLSTFV